MPAAPPVPATVAPSPKARRVYLTNPAFQLRFVGFTLFIAVLAIGVFYISNLYFIWKFMEIGRSLNFPEGHPFFRFLVEQRHLMNSIFAVTALVVGLLISVGGLLLSHRVAGPLRRLQSHIEQVRETREFRSVQFREGDFFAELAASFNEMMIVFRQSYARRKDDPGYAPESGAPDGDSGGGDDPAGRERRKPDPA